MLNIILGGLAGLLLVGLAVELRKLGFSENVISLLLQLLEDMILSKAIAEAELWAKQQAEKVSGQAKFQKALERAQQVTNLLAEWGIGIGLDEEALKAKLQKKFDEIKEDIEKIG